MYSILQFGGGEKKAANGVLAQIKNDEITRDDYKNCLENLEERFHVGTKIFQKNHQLYTANVLKKTLNPYNDKKYISFEDGEFTCFSYGHDKIHKFVQDYYS